MNELTPMDLHHVLARTPRDVRKMLQEQRIFMAGGFIRAIVADEKPADVDLWGAIDSDLQHAATQIAMERQGKLHRTKNAYTVLSPDRMPLQFIRRWLFTEAEAVLSSFDFTVCAACIWWEAPAAQGTQGQWKSAVHPNFYVDLAARRLVYLTPTRDEDPGGSMMRVLKYMKRGYHIEPESLGKVISRLVGGIRDLGSQDEDLRARLLIALLREVDPLLVIDGLELLEDTDDQANSQGKAAA